MEELSRKTAVDAVKRMKNKSKFPLLYGNGDWHTHGVKKTPLVALEMHDGPCGVRKPSDNKAQDNANLPSSFPSTCFPAPCLVACSWDPEIEALFGERIALECLDQKTDIILAPGVNIKRNPLCGRNFEYLSEDPLLAGKMASGFINGCQGLGVGTSLKHFACNNQEFRRMNYSAEVDERALREIYLKPFEIAIKEANPWTVMCSYNKINGIYSSENSWLLQKILRKEWGYEGAVISDWGAVNDPIGCHTKGLDIEMPCHINRGEDLARGLKNGHLTPDSLNDCASHVATLSDKLASRPKNSDAFNYGMSFDAAKKIAESSIVLAKNTGKTLPLSDFKDCCVIGALAKEARYQGGGSSLVNPKHLVTLLEAINEGRDENGIDFAPGYSLHPGEDSTKYLLDAVDLASSHKKVLLVLGLPSEIECEGYDRRNMRLPDNQYTLVDALVKANPNIILILTLGAPVELPFVDAMKAVLIAYLPGEVEGKAIKDILLGDANPSGKLAETWPFHYVDVPSYEFYPGKGDLSLYKESIFVGYRYYLTTQKKVCFPFGFGLSYSTFKYSDLELSTDTLKANANLKATVYVKNISLVDGSEVVELYLSQPNSVTIKPLRELKAFAKVRISAGKEKKITFTIPYSFFAHFDSSSGTWQVEGGDYVVEIGTSCEDICAKKNLKVLSDFEPHDKHDSLPSYYALANSQTLRISDAEFQNLLSHAIPEEKDKHHRPFTQNSTFEEISRTFIGRKVKKFLLKNAENPKLSKEANEDVASSMMNYPLRMALMAGFSQKKLLAIVDAANGKFLKAIWDLQFGKIS